MSIKWEVSVRTREKDKERRYQQARPETPDFGIVTELARSLHRDTDSLITFGGKDLISVRLETTAR